MNLLNIHKQVKPYKTCIQTQKLHNLISKRMFKVVIVHIN